MKIRSIKEIFENHFSARKSSKRKTLLKDDQIRNYHKKEKNKQNIRLLITLVIAFLLIIILYFALK